MGAEPQKRDGEIRTIRHFLYLSWPDHGVPVFATSLLNFRKKIHSYNKLAQGPTIVHCSAGIGRTGTYISVDMLIQQALTENKVNIFETVSSLRQQRMNMVQVQDQYRFVHNALVEEFSTKNTTISAANFNTEFESLSQENEYEANADTSELYKQYMSLKELRQSRSYDDDDISGVSSSDDDNEEAEFMFPPEKPKEMANFIHGYTRRNAVLTTKPGIAENLNELLDLIHLNDVSALIVLDQFQDLGAWSDKIKTEKYTLLVEPTEEKESETDLKETLFTLQAKDKSTKKFCRFELPSWKTDNVPKNESSMLKLTHVLQRWQKQHNDGRILVYCKDGMSKTGLFCCCFYILEQLKIEQEVDIFSTVKIMKENNEGFIGDYAQYVYLYRIVQQYIASNAEYANFV